MHIFHNMCIVVVTIYGFFVVFISYLMNVLVVFMHSVYYLSN